MSLRVIGHQVSIEPPLLQAIANALHFPPEFNRKTSISEDTASPQRIKLVVTWKLHLSQHHSLEVAMHTTCKQR